MGQKNEILTNLNLNLKKNLLAHNGECNLFKIIFCFFFSHFGPKISVTWLKMYLIYRDYFEDMSLWHQKWANPKVVNQTIRNFMNSTTYFYPIKKYNNENFVVNHSRVFLDNEKLYFSLFNLLKKYDKLNNEKR
jgi:hypothetical protein